MRDQSLREWNRASKFTMLLVFIINVILGIGAFFNFRRYDLPDNLFKRENGQFKLWNDDWWSHGASWMLVGLMVMTVPLCVHVTREYVEAIIIKISELRASHNNKDRVVTDEEAVRTEIERGQEKKTVSTMESQNGELGQENAKETETENASNCMVGLVGKFQMTPSEYIITISVFALAVLLSVALKGDGGIKKVMEVVGDIGCSGMAFLLPPIIFVRTFKKKEYSLFCLVSAILVFLLGMGIWIHMVVRWIESSQSKQATQ